MLQINNMGKYVPVMGDRESMRDFDAAIDVEEKKRLAYNFCYPKP
jgi:hypothetical protein